jgi:uncharacterized protein (DUF1697 family)
MTRFVAMLRGVNVGGRATVSMADLRRVVAGLGYDDVQTYIQSGNVLFSTGAPATAVVSTIEQGLGEELGREIAVVLRTHAQLAAVVARNPLAGGGRDPSRLHVTFLATAPARPRVAALDEGAFLPDEFRVVGREVYVHCPGGYGRTTITNTYFERALGVVATTRSLKTVTELVRRSA